MKAEDRPIWRRKSRQALARLYIELSIGGSGPPVFPPDLKLVSFVVLDATLSGHGISAARIALITGVGRTTIRRRLRYLAEQGVIYEDRGWRMTPAYLERPGLRDWISRVDRLVQRAHTAMSSDMAGPANLRLD